MIYRVVLDDLYDLHTSDINCMLLNPSLELEMNAAGSFNFTLPPTHPYWNNVEILKSTIDVYEDNDLIFTGRVANIDKNWNNERVIECEGALAYFNDSIHRQMKWETPLPIASEDPNVHNFLKDILDNHNVFVGDATNRQIHIGHIYVDPYLVTREVDYDTTLDILTRMCIDTNGGYFMIRKDPETHLLYLDWLKDFTEESGQPASFGVNLLDFNTGLHAADICTGVLARGATVNDQVVTLSNVELVDETTYPDLSVDHYTTHDQDILWHRDGMAKFGRVVQVHDFPDAQTDWKNDGQIVGNSLFEEARKWLEEKNTKVESIEVEVAELSWLKDGVPKYKLGQIVQILDDAHMAGEPYEVRCLPMYKLSCDLSSGSKKVTLGRPPKKELTQISASNSDSSTLSSGNSSGSSSGGGSGSGEECKVHDVCVDGTSVVTNKIANISLTGKADVSTVNALAATVATKADASTVTALATAVAGKQNQIEFNTAEAATETLARLKADGTVYNLGGGTEVEANPSETATDDLETIKIGDTVYDIPGSGGGSTNYGKFTCELIFNTATQSSGWSDSVTVCTKDVLDEYDAIYVTDGMMTNGAIRQETKFVLVKDIESIGDNGFQYMFGTDPNGTSFFVFGLRVYNNNLVWYSDRNGGYLFKVYGIKFENKLINRSDIYSEEERMIGRWTDGKPLYQKTVITTNTTVNNWVRVDISSLNIDSICDLYGQFTRYVNNKDYWYEFTGAESLYSGNYVGVLRFDFENSGGELTYRINFEATNKQIFTIQYTKTTDTADSGVLPEDPMFISDPMIYSEEEQVVGSWTDGKPLYQKTFLQNWTSNGEYHIDVTSLSIDNFIYAEGFANRYDVMEFSEEVNVNFVNNVNSYRFLVWYNRESEYLRCLLNMPENRSSRQSITIRYTKTTDSILSGPKKGKIVQRSDIYSEEERLVGRWTDGKPLYQKTWIKVLPSAHDYDGGLAYLIDSDVSYIDEMISGNGYLKETTVGAVSILNGGIPNMDGWSYGIHITGTKQLVLYGATRTTYVPGATAVITLQYTKTTDLPFSKQLIEDPQFVMMSDIYSEDEQVVGRWTDGKPIYQKTYLLGSGVYITNNGISISSYLDNLSTYDQIIDAIGYGKNNNDARTDSLYLNTTGMAYCAEGMMTNCVTVQYTKTTDVPGTGPTKGNLIYLPALYSEEEREVGVWTDGKPLYQKVAEVNITSGELNVWVNHNIPGLSDAELIHYDYDILFLEPSLGKNAIYDSMFRFEVCRLTTTQYYIITGSGWNTGNIKVRFIIQYTKTTDQPGSGTWTPEGQLAHHYSTSEKIVGTWIDGSTVYERTWDLGSDTAFSNNTWTTIVNNVGISINKIIKCEGVQADPCAVSFDIWFDTSFNSLKARSLRDGNETIRYFTIQYTKSS